MQCIIFARKLSPMKDIARQKGSEHDEHISKYKALISDPDGIRKQLEKLGKDALAAQEMLGKIVMVCK